MEPNRKDIADLFSVVFDKSSEITVAPGPRKGTTADQSVRLGAQSLTEGDYDKAIEHFRRAVEQRDPDDVQGRIDLGAAYETTERAPEALRQYERALRIRQDQPDLLLGISQVYKRHSRYKDSMVQMEKALKLEPTNSFLQFKLAEILREIGEMDKAILAARLAVLGSPTDPFYHFWVGDLLIEMKRFDEALEALRAALELSPGDDFLYLRAATAFWGSGRNQEAVKSVRLAGDLDPDNYLYNGVLECLLNEMGQHEEAGLESKSAAKMDDYARDLLERFKRELDL